MTTRRNILAAGIALGGATILPATGFGQTQDAHTYQTETGEITVHPISHASFVLETPDRVIYVDPVGDPSAYADLPEPDLILVTHEHGDHYNPETLAALAGPATQMVVNTAVYDMLPEDLQTKAQQAANGDTVDVSGLMIEAVPAHNITEGRLDFHPEGRDNGYVFEIDGRRIYVAGDTEGTEEMRALQDIFLAFVPMNLPFTMDAAQAADAVAAFQPAYVYPYHYRGQDGGTQDPAEFERLLQQAGAETETRMGDWYAEGEI